MKPDYVIHAHKSAFITWRVFTTALKLLSVFILLIVFFAFTEPRLALITIGVYVLVVGIYYAHRRARFHKTSIEVYPTRLVMKTGSLVSDSQTTLNIKNITLIGTREPWIENKLFGTGALKVVAAGNTGIQVRIPHTTHCEKHLEYIVALMKNNGFSLQKKELLQQEKPVKAAVILSMLPIIAVVGLGSFFVLGVIATIATVSLWAVPAGLLILAAAWTLLIISLKDSLAQEYFVYDDCIEYFDGFLTRQHRILAAEKIADSNNTQSIVDRIVGTSNLRISTLQGTVTFNHMANGERLEATIDRIASRDMSKSEVRKQKESVQTQKATSQRPASFVSKSTFTGKYKQDLRRVLAIPALIAAIALIALIAGVVLGIGLALVFLAAIGGFWLALGLAIGIAGSVIQALRTEYEIRKQGVHETYALLSRRSQELSDEKIVSVTVNESLLDRILQTKQVTFSSISGESVTFKHIKDHQELLLGVKEKYGYTSKHQHTHNAEYSLLANFTKALPAAISLFVLLITAAFITPLLSDFTLQTTLLLAIGIFAAGCILWALTRIFMYPRYKHSSLHIHKNHFEHVVGWLHITKTFMRLEHTRHVSAKKYRLSEKGEVFIAAGGSRSAGEKNQQAIIANGIRAHYLNNTHSIVDSLDEQFLGQELQKEEVMSAKPQKRNTALGLIWIPPLMLVLIWRLAKITYVFEEQRIVSYSGIWNKKKDSYLYANIDHLGVKKGILNKIFSNETITVYTLGSHSADIALQDLSEGKKIEKQLEEHYL